MTRSVVVAVLESSHIGAARRAAAAVAARAALDETQAGKVALIVTELAANLVRHAGGGQIVLRARQEERRRGVEVLALDTGPGLVNAPPPLADCYSTGSAGQGLGAVIRQSDEFDLYSLPGQGAALLARVWAAFPEMGAPVPTAPSPSQILTGAVCLPVTSEVECGDAWAEQRQGARTLLAVVDGLGHGPGAAAAAEQAVRIFHGSHRQSPGEILEAAHAGLRSTCGAVMGVAEIRTDLGQLCWAGIGNISGEICCGETSSHLVSHNGALGRQVRQVREFVYPWAADCLLVLHSDGLVDLRRGDRSPELWRRDPSLVAGVLYRDFRREPDDVTVLAARQGGVPSYKGP